MKSAKAIGKARNARLNQVRKGMIALADILMPHAGTPHHVPIMEADFWETGRDLVAQMLQAFHEANAYNNSLVSDGIKFDREFYEIRAPGPAAKTPDFDSGNGGSNPPEPTITNRTEPQSNVTER